MRKYKLRCAPRQEGMSGGDVVELLTNPLYSKPWMGLPEGEEMNRLERLEY
jgi:hypothetical protein